MHMHKGFSVKTYRPRFTEKSKIYKEKQGPCHILGSRDASNQKLSPVSPLDKRS